MIITLGVICKKCSNIVTKEQRTCECGNVALRGLDFYDKGMVLYVDDTTTVDLVDVYVNEKDNRIAKFKYRPSIEFGKAYPIKQENK